MQATIINPFLHMYLINEIHGLVAESGKIEKEKVRRKLVGARILVGLGALGKLGLEGLLLSMYPNYIF